MPLLPRCPPKLCFLLPLRYTHTTMPPLPLHSSPFISDNFLLCFRIRSPSSNHVRARASIFSFIAADTCSFIQLVMLALDTLALPANHT